MEFSEVVRGLSPKMCRLADAPGGPGVYAAAVATTTSDGEIIPFSIAPLKKGIDEKDDTPAGDDARGVGHGERSRGGSYHYPMP